MKSEAIVIDSGPLILLAKIDALSILDALRLHCVAPTSVQDELEAGPLYGHPPVRVPMLFFYPLSAPIPAYVAASLDDGEAAVIQLALEQGIKKVCLDDRRGRNLAKALGLEVVGLLGLLIRAKRKGIISAVKPYCERLISVGARYSPGLIQKVLTAVNE